MRRNDRQMSEEWAWAFLARGIYGVLSLYDGKPYGVPLSYVLSERTVYFHCAKEGRKTTCMLHSPVAHFTVVDDVQAVYDNSFSTYYSSVMAEGTLFEVADPQEKGRILALLAAKYLPDDMEHAEAHIAKSLERTMVLGLRITALTGKAKRPEGNACPASSASTASLA